MSLASSEKIFVDVKEEITFILEKILASEKERIIIVVPENSILFSSIISLKILLKLAQKEGKSVILVTEDQFGLSIAQKADFIAVQKVSQISSDLWESALNKQLSQKKRFNKNKDKFSEQAGEVVQVQGSRDKGGVEGDGAEIDVDVVVGADGDVEVEDSSEETQNFASVRGEEKTNEAKSDNIHKPKVVNLGGIEIYSGADVAQFEYSDNNSLNQDVMDRKLDLPDSSIFSSDRFSGKDLSKIAPKKGLLEKVSSKLSGGDVPKEFEDRENPLKASSSKKFYQKRSFMILVALPIVLIIAGLLFVEFASSVTLNISPKVEEVLASENVKASTTAKEVDTTTLTLPIKVLKIDDVKSSRNVTATGEGVKGTKSKGLVEVFNQNLEQIKIPKGTEIVSVANQLTYKFINDTTLPAATQDQEGPITPSITQNVQVEAADIGKEYNIDSDASTAFTLKAFDDVEVKRDGTFEGGKSEKFLAVAQKDIDGAKKSMTPEIVNQGKTDLVDKVPEGYILIEDSVKFDQKTIEASPKVGKAPLQDKTFTLTLSGTITSFVVSETDLNQLMAFVITQKQAAGEGATDEQIQDIKSIKITEFKQDASNITFKISSVGVSSPNFDVEQIRESIKGKGLEEARQILRSNKLIDGFTLRFSPSIIPDSLQKVPNNFDKIIVNIN